MKKIIRKFSASLRSMSRQSIKNYVFLGIACIVFASSLLFIWLATFQIPTLESFEARRVEQSTKIYDKTGEILLYDVNQNVQRTTIPYSAISQNVKNATIAIEDKNFYQHGAIDPKSILRAVFANTTSFGYAQGGSTITQQVIKNALFTSEKLISRKIKEIVLAYKLEKVMSKDEILNLYLNEIPYGGAVYGIEEASQNFYGKHASDLTITESAYMAALPQAPTYYSPYGLHKDKLEDRKNIVLSEMRKDNFISQSEYDSAIKETVVFKPKQSGGIKAPHFVFYVIDQLSQKYGDDMIQTGGLRVKTTLDYTLQQKGEGIANKFALQNKKNFNAENAAFVAIDPKTGGILTMVGSRNYFDKEIDGNFNIATAKRQPGSTFKPFVYAESFVKGYTPETVVFDVKTQFSTNCAPENLSSSNGCYSPENYDLKYRGPITLRNSLAQSINISSIKVLYLAGLNDSLNLAKKMGITTLGNSGQYGLTLVLGGGEVTPLDMVSSYSVFANEGVRNPYVSILEVKDSTGKILEEYKENPTEVLQRDSALKISSILSDNVARSPAYGQTSALSFGERDVAVKTGTTNDYKDAWIIGYTPSITLGAWAGNNNNTPMEKKVAGFIVAPMWRAFMDEILKTVPVEKFPAPPVEDSFDLKPVLRGHWEGGISQKVDTLSGKQATQFTPRETTKEILTGGVHTILYWLDKNDPRGPAPQNPQKDPQFNAWEYGVSRWLQNQNYTPPQTENIPTETDTVHTADSQPKISLSLDSSGYIVNNPITLSPVFSTSFPISKVEYNIDGIPVGESALSPFSLTFVPESSGILVGNHILKVTVTDSVYNRASVEQQITIVSQ